jgi:hypothetical protein
MYWLACSVKDWSSLIVDNLSGGQIIYRQGSRVCWEPEWGCGEECIHGSCHDESLPPKNVALGAT